MFISIGNINSYRTLLCDFGYYKFQFDGFFTCLENLSRILKQLGDTPKINTYIWLSNYIFTNRLWLHFHFLYIWFSHNSKLLPKLDIYLAFRHLFSSFDPDFGLLKRLSSEILLLKAKWEIVHLHHGENTVTFRWDDDYDVRFVLDQQTQLDFYSASSLN